MQDEVRRIIEPVLAATDREFGPSYSAVVYGSAAREEFQEGVSDVNLLLVGGELGPAALRRLAPGFTGLGTGYRPPLLVEPEEWARAADVFPIEITDMQIAHQIVRGGDPVSGMTVERSDLRRSLEQELRGKLLRLRQAYAGYADDPRALAEVAAQTVSSVATLFRVALSLAGGPVPLPTPACLAAAGRALGVDPGPVAALWEMRRRGESSCPPERFEGYLAAVRSAVHVIDQFT